MFVHESFDMCINTTLHQKLLKQMLINEIFVQFGNTTVLNYLNENMVFEVENLNSITGFKNYEIDDFKHLFDSTTLKVFMGILFLIVETFKNFEVLLFIDVGIHRHQF